MSASAEDDEYLQAPIEQKWTQLLSANNRIAGSLSRAKRIQTQEAMDESQRFIELVRVDLSGLAALDEVIRLRDEIEQEASKQITIRGSTKSDVDHISNPRLFDKRYGSIMKVGLYILAAAGFVAYVFALASSV